MAHHAKHGSSFKKQLALMAKQSALRDDGSTQLMAQDRQ
jgi:hypothetical protein